MDTFTLLALIFLLGIAAIIDLDINKIPNWLTLSAIAILLANHVALRGFAGFQFGLYGTFMGIGLMLLPYILGWMGAGDAKLLGAVGCAIGVKGVVLAFLFSGVMGGIFAIILLIKHRGEIGLKAFFKNEYNSLIYVFSTKSYSPYAKRQQLSAIKIPYGVAIACGTGISIGLKSLGFEILPI